jgi:hypothetical protein
MRIDPALKEQLDAVAAEEGQSRQLVEGTGEGGVVGEEAKGLVKKVLLYFLKNVFNYINYKWIAFRNIYFVFYFILNVIFFQLHDQAI